MAYIPEVGETVRIRFVADMLRDGSLDIDRRDPNGCCFADDMDKFSGLTFEVCAVENDRYCSDRINISDICCGHSSQKFGRYYYTQYFIEPVDERLQTNNVYVSSEVSDLF